MARRLVLASASPARRRLLEAAGFDPEVVVSGVDEDSVRCDDAASLVTVLATHKALAVADRLAREEEEQPPRPAIVVGCDSVLSIGSEICGKPASPQEALARWRRMRGSTGLLLTGHCVIDTSSGESRTGCAQTTVRFGTPTDDELEAYVASGEPLGVAGAFTLDGRSGPFIAGIEGDPSNVIGLSLPLFRALLAGLGIPLHELWT